MKRSFMLPAAVALSGHALLLFGFHRDPRPSGPLSTEKTERENPPWVMKLAEVEPPLPEAAAAGGGPPDVPVLPRTPDLPQLPPVNAMVMVPTPRALQVVEGRVTRIDPRALSFGSGGEGPGGSPWVIDPTALDEPPRARQQLAPAYPFEGRREGRSGEVLVEFVVDEEGRVVNPRVVRSSDAIFEAPTLRAVEKWRFQPGRKQGQPVRFRMTIPIVFNIDNA